MPSSGRNNTGILSNSYIPTLTTKALSKQLHRLEPKSLFSLVKLWIKWPITQPTLNKEHKKRNKTKGQLISDVEALLSSFNRDQSSSALLASQKVKLIDKILVEYWSNGLNILQLALIDTQCVIDGSNNFSWVSSTAKVVTGSSSLIDSFNSTSYSGGYNDSAKYSEIDAKFENFIFSLDPQSFLDTLIKTLSSMYTTHIYISRHHTLPLILIRIQIFDVNEHSSSHMKRKAQNDTNSPSRGMGNLNNNNEANSGSSSSSFNTDSGFKPEIRSRKPYYLVIPLSSPNIIHSDTDDLVSQIIIQAVEMTLSSRLRQIRLVRGIEHPVRTLEAMHVLKGVSRFSNSLGSWIPYADGIVDINPLGDYSQHLAINPMRLTNNEDDDDENDDNDDNIDESEESKEERRKRREKLKTRKLIANLKFKGSALKIQSERLFEDTRPAKKKKTADGDGADTNNDQSSESKNEYASVAPIQYAEFNLENKIVKRTEAGISTGSRGDPPSVRLRFLGNDVFAGLHELCIVNEVIDPEKIPSWLTGSENKSIGLIRDNELLDMESTTVLE